MPDTPYKALLKKWQADFKNLDAKDKGLDEESNIAFGKMEQLSQCIDELNAVVNPV